MPSCRNCADDRDTAGDRADPAALAWVRERDPDGRERWLCPSCARRHLRDIEAKLPHEWW